MVIYLGRKPLKRPIHKPLRDEQIFTQNYLLIYKRPALRFEPVSYPKSHPLVPVPYLLKAGAFRQMCRSDTVAMLSAISPFLVHWNKFTLCYHQTFQER